ncbi:hypothetical protein ElyMa_001515800 [Elysia marginata]|uniref:Uncharacterized protein n=1 Tax=Elysia marginata TaxID=1093978 RepID=A0AAV4J8E3_9GAST|nr:hypothetical protein ElyMa_001515800 [Elysia marginata]
MFGCPQPEEKRPKTVYGLEGRESAFKRAKMIPRFKVSRKMKSVSHSKIDPSIHYHTAKTSLGLHLIPAPRTDLLNHRSTIARENLRSKAMVETPR